MTGQAANFQAEGGPTYDMVDSDTIMSRFDAPDIDSLPEDIQERIEEETDRAGFTPNIFQAMAYRPSHFRAFFAYHDALVEETALEREEIEMIIVAVSGVNDCLYCIVAHGALLRIYADAPKLAEQVAANHRTADINETHRAMLDFAVKLTESPARIEDEDLERLEEYGYSRRAIWDIGSVAAFFNLSNRLAQLADIRPNEEFYDLGR
ncbi:alkyl hydroperoxide reductase AhpD [Haloarcula mannanilytica]|uniref:Alkyl hydroperoxide reductase AhpD n=2 Tax=Haloarcula mannanilytica TaxID=2509225 RepID=A0A4C2EJ70_9EURY|nr:alkyl hydroperoxide reductase AhpD [Haloarcula mannanilytica]